jgi:hypothetical protein
VASTGVYTSFKGMTTATSGVLARFPLLLPVRNSVASYGASAVARTPGRGHVAEVRNQCHRGDGVSIRVSKETFLPLNVQPVFSSHHKDELLYARTHQRCVMRMSVRTMDVRVNMGDTIDPFQLANGFETVISYEYQERSNHSNPPLFHLDDTNKSCKV